MKNTTLKTVLAALALTIAQTYSLLGWGISIANFRDIGKNTTVTISAKKSDGTIVKKGSMYSPTKNRGERKASFYGSFDPTDIIVIEGGNHPRYEIKVSDLEPSAATTPSATIIMHDNNCTRLKYQGQVEVAVGNWIKATEPGGPKT